MKSQKNRQSAIDNRISNIPSNIAKSPHRPIVKSPNLQIILFFLLSASLFAQNEANIWYFPYQCGLDFNSGEPVVLHDGQAMWGIANSTISDSTGNLLFYADGWRIYDKNHGRMLNDSSLTMSDGVFGRIIVKWPEKSDLYFVFKATYTNYMYNGFYYSLVDMNGNNGQGEVIENNVPIDAGWDVSDRVFTVRQSNSENIWVITRKFEDDAYASFLIDENGFNPVPIISPLPDRDPESSIDWGYIKVSYDKKYLIACYQMQGELEVCSFNASNGEFEYMYTIMTPPETGTLSDHGMEFSPDSKLLYVSYRNYDSTDVIYQYDMKLITDSVSFRNSAMLVGTGSAYGLQLARDGKIYCTPFPVEDPEEVYLMSVINNPWIRGEGCLLLNNVVNMYPGHDMFSLPNILLDYLYRFEWKADNYCVGTHVKFKPNFIPEPDSIRWFFDEFEPGSTSFELYPEYTFLHPGVHEIVVDVWYPSGRYEHTSRELEIYLNPEPDLGADTTICEGNTLQLNANCIADQFAWSNGQFGVPSITVSDSGTYWVRAKFLLGGCEAYDTIHVGFHAPTIIDETNLILTPTACNGASGSIIGLQALGSMPFAYQWLDLSGNDYGTNIDATVLPAGQFQLTITDGNGCETTSNVYTIEDAGNLQVLVVDLIQPHCGRPDGQIIVHGFNPSGSALQYSIDDGATYQADSVFSGLVAAGYVVRVTDGAGCFGFYPSNPVVLADIPGPQVTQVNVTDETDFLGNGSIEIVANGSTPTIYYSIDSGATWQINDGNFYDLISTTYYIIIKDDNGCDTTFTVEVQNIILTYLHAVTGEGGECLGNTALVPVNVDNFNSVADFHLKLGYNADNLECEGFANVHPQLVDSLIGWVDQAAGDIHLAWKSPTSVTFPGTEKVADLAFTTKNPGQGQLSWYTGETESYFTNATGNPIPAEFSTGEVIVYEPPNIFLAQSKTFCTGDTVFIMSIATGNQPPIDYLWIYPTGDTSRFDPFFFSITQADAGLYTLLATDRVGCTDQKSIELIVSENAVAAFHGTDTLEMHAGDVLDAGEGMASYRWSPGDTTQSIVIQEAGMYIVEMESPAGCLGSDSVYVKLTTEEIPETHLFLPNAFTPNGDGVNDTFLPLYNGNDLSHFTMEVYDRWGGRIFRSENILFGWDGKKNGNPCPGGVYVYKIVFSVDGVPGNQERVGTVMLVR
jgi:gliding motility-associated-like protein